MIFDEVRKKWIELWQETDQELLDQMEAGDEESRWTEKRERHLAYWWNCPIPAHALATHRLPNPKNQTPVIT